VVTSVDGTRHRRDWGDAAECEDRSRRWMAYNPLFKNSYVDVDMF
jgi:hypothetical protein